MLKISFLLEMLLNRWVTSNKNILFLGFSNFEDENTILPQTGIQLPIDTSHGRRTESSATLLHEPQNSQPSTIHTQHYYGFHQLCVINDETITKHY